MVFKIKNVIMKYYNSNSKPIEYLKKMKGRGRAPTALCTVGPEYNVIHSPSSVCRFPVLQDILSIYCELDALRYRVK